MQHSSLHMFDNAVMRQITIKTNHVYNHTFLYL